jgi:cytochrome c oxidase subunit 1/cytochrome c oxidase subunit I+III
MPGDSYAPFLLGLFSTLLFAAMLLHAWWLALLMLAGFVASLSAWMWPETPLRQREPQGETLG